LEEEKIAWTEDYNL